MSSYINVFLKTEVTVIPSLLDKYVGKYYNNALCNGATWMFAFWYFLHLGFDSFLNALLTKMRYKEYIRIRLKKSLWYLGFYNTALFYSVAILARHNVPLINFARVFDQINTPPPHFILGCIVLMTFYLHSALWERVKYCNGALGISYFLLFLFSILSYFLRGYIEGSFKLTALICATQVLLELARCVAILMRTNNAVSDAIVKLFFSSSMLAFSINYLLLVPLALGYPLLLNFSLPALHLFSLLLVWFVIEMHNSAFFKLVLHWLNHEEESTSSLCPGNFLECSLFPARDDATYNYLLLKRESKEREARQISMRKPKNRNMVMQTLKCMVAIKRKLKEKRRRSSSGEPSKKEDGCSDDSVGGKETETGISPVIFRENVESREESELVNGKLQFRIQPITRADDDDSYEEAPTSAKYKED